MAAVAKSLVTDSSCIFCKIVAGTIPAKKLFETSKSVAFLDAFPISHGHMLVIPKHHGERLTDIPVSSQKELLPIAAALARQILPVVGAEDFNVLQNNGYDAHQRVGHVHVHMIPKPKPEPAAEPGEAGGEAQTETVSARAGSGLGVVWPMTKGADQTVVERILDRLAADDGWKEELRRELGEADEANQAALSGAILKPRGPLQDVISNN